MKLSSFGAYRVYYYTGYVFISHTKINQSFFFLYSVKCLPDLRYENVMHVQWNNSCEYMSIKWFLMHNEFSR